MKSLDGTVAVITGASRGLGLATAHEYASAGAAVVLAARSEGDIQAAAERISTDGGRARAVRCDVSDRADVMSLARTAIAEFGRFDVWINNAASSAPFGPTWRVPLDRIRTTMETDIFGVLYGSWIAVHHFLERGGGTLINILGRGANGISANQNAYASSKAWVRHFSLTLAKELEDEPIRVVAFNPGLMYTDLVGQVETLPGSQGRFKVFERVLALWAEPPEVPAQTAVWLATEQAAGVGPEHRQHGRWAMLVNGIARGIPMMLGRRRPRFPVSVSLVEPAVSPFEATADRSVSMRERTNDA
jgi:glucose 1-dehydrogenase